MSVEIEFINADITVEFIDTIVTPELTGDQITVEFLDTPTVVEFTGTDVTVETTTTTTEVVVENTDVSIEFPQVITYNVAGLDLNLINAGFPSTTFIYNSSGTQTGTRFNSWTDLMAAIGLSEYGGPRNILFEQNETIPVGTYDLTDITLLGNGLGILGGGLYVQFDTGTSLTNDILRVGAGLNVRWAGTGTLMDGTGSFTGVKAIYLSDEASVLPTGGGSFIAIDTGAEARLVAFQGQTNIFAGDAAFGNNGYLINCDTSATSATVVLVDNAGGTVWTNDMLYVSSALNTATITYYIYSDTTSALGIDLRTQTNGGPGTITYSGLSILAPNADRLTYTPTVTADWTGADPTTVQEALDRIAAALGPIA